MSARPYLFWLKTGLLAGALALALVAQAEDRAARIKRLNVRFGDYHRQLVADSNRVRDPAQVEEQVSRLVENAIAQEAADIHGQIMLMGIDLTNRLADRYVDRKQLLGRLSELGYTLDLHNRPDTAHIDLVFALGILEHARGDMQAARMWFDSTLSFRAKGIELNLIAAAAKLRGYVNREEGRYVEAAQDFALALQLLEKWHGRTDDIIDARSAWAAAVVDAGGDVQEALRESTRAYETLIADDFLLQDWTFAYLVYLNHARVLTAAGLPAEAVRVAHAGLALARLRQDGVSVAFAQLHIARIELSLKHYRAAVSAGDAALQVFESTHQENHLAEAHEYLEIAHEQLGNLRQSLRHAREGKRLRIKLGEDSRLETLFTLQRDYRTAQAEHKALLATESATRAELENSRTSSQRTSLILAICFVGALLAFTFQRLRARRRHTDELGQQVAARTEQLAKQTHQLERKTRSLEASNLELERFAYIASHDLKTPLRNVTSFLGLIDRRMPEEARPAIGEFLTLAQTYARSMDTLVDDVLEFSRLNGDIDEISSIVNLRQLCTRLVESFVQPEGVAIPTVVILGGATLYAPESFLRQLIGNLLSNGIKYNHSAQPRVTIEIFDTSADITIRVRDNGIGIAPHYHTRVFEMFRRLHTCDDFAGTGLGLASCRKIAERLGGQIGLESELGQGSTFTVILPRRAQVTATVTAQQVICLEAIS